MSHMRGGGLKDLLFPTSDSLSDVNRRNETCLSLLRSSVHTKSLVLSFQKSVTKLQPMIIIWPGIKSANSDVLFMLRKRLSQNTSLDRRLVRTLFSNLSKLAWTWPNKSLKCPLLQVALLPCGRVCHQTSCTKVPHLLFLYKRLSIDLNKIRPLWLCNSTALWRVCKANC